MTPDNELFTVMTNGTAYPADLDALRQWIQEGRISAYTQVARGGGSRVSVRDIAELREFFAPQPPAASPRPAPRAAFPPQPLPAVPQPVPNPSGPPVRPFQVNTYQGDFPNEAHKLDRRYTGPVGMIRRGYVMGYLLSTVLFLTGMITLLFEPPSVGPDGSTVPNQGKPIIMTAIVMLLLNAGLSFRSRVCAVLLFGWVAADLVLLLILMRFPIGIGISAVLSIFYFFALIGTFDYHKFRKEVESGHF